MQPSEWLSWICSSQNLDDLTQNYDRWSDTYETDISEVWKPVPAAAALMLAQHVSDPQQTILDVGVGTGLVGVELAKLGFSKIVGIDISPGMLVKAAEKGVYGSLVCGSIGSGPFRSLDPIYHMIAIGVFAEGQAGLEELRTLQSTIAPQGILVLTARQSFLHELQEVFNQPEWMLLETKTLPIYEDPMLLLAFQIQDSSPSSNRSVKHEP